MKNILSLFPPRTKPPEKMSLRQKKKTENYLRTHTWYQFLRPKTNCVSTNKITMRKKTQQQQPTTAPPKTSQSGKKITFAII